jgi:hypothetical protein
MYDYYDYLHLSRKVGRAIKSVKVMGWAPSTQTSEAKFELGSLNKSHHLGENCVDVWNI